MSEKELPVSRSNEHSASPSYEKKPSQRWTIPAHIGLLVLVSLTLFLFKAHTLPLADPEEARCALIVRNMADTGEWIVPQMNGQPYYDKPAPFFWLVAVGERLTGDAELGGRLVPGLFALVAVLAAYGLGYRIFGPTAALVAGLVLATFGEFLFLARWYRMDMPYVSMMWVALWAFWMGQPGRDELMVPVLRRRWAWLGFYAFCGISVLFKGPVGVLLPVLVVFFYLLLSGRPRRVLELFDWRGILLFFVITVPWYLAISLRLPDYAYQFFVEQNFVRYSSESFDRRNFSGLMYIPILFLGMLPWTVYLPGVFIRLFPRRWKLRAENPGLLFLWLAMLVPLLFFIGSKTVLINYILPVFPPLAVLVAALIARWILAPEKPDPLMKLGLRAMQGILALMPLLVVAAGIWFKNVGFYWIALALAVCWVGVWRMGVLLMRHRRGRAFAWAGAGTVVFFLAMIGQTAEPVYKLMSQRDLAEIVIPLARENAVFCTWYGQKESFAYYVGARSITHLDEDSLADLARLREWMASDRTVYCLVRTESEFNRLKEELHVPFFVLGQSQDQWLISNRPVAGAVPIVPPRKKPTSRPQTQPASLPASMPASQPSTQATSWPATQATGLPTSRPVLPQDFLGYPPPPEKAVVAPTSQPAPTAMRHSAPLGKAAVVETSVPVEKKSWWQGCREKLTSENIWLMVGFFGQVLFGSRFLVQWIATERQKKSVIPLAFWYLSLSGSVVLLVYSIYRRDIVFVAGFSLNLVIYLRNLYYIHGHKSVATGREGSDEKSS